VLDLNDFFYFVQVVDRGGFTAAGRTLRLPKSTLSHRVQQLETRLGVRLLNRTSRKFAMTDAGEEFYRHAVAMLREAEGAESAIRHRLSEPVGSVRCTAAVATAQFAMREMVSDFLIRYPKVDLTVHATIGRSISSAKTTTSRSGRIPIRCRIPLWCGESLHRRLGSCSPAPNISKPPILRKRPRT
jgi:DNA-binding transcriptional LysR family regulator